MDDWSRGRLACRCGARSVPTSAEPRCATGPVAAIAGGCLVGRLGFLALYAFQSPWAWIAIRVLMSAGFALPWLAGETWINTVSREETRGRVIAIYTMAFFAGFSLGPIILQAFGLVGSGRFSSVRRERHSPAFQSFLRNGSRPSSTMTARWHLCRHCGPTPSRWLPLSSVDLPRSVVSALFRMSPSPQDFRK